MLLQDTTKIEEQVRVDTERGVQGPVATQHGPCEWRELDRRLREYAQHRAALDAAEAFDLVRAEQLKIYFLLGFANLFEYMERVLGYGPHAARERMRIARTLAKLPETTAALARGELPYSAVRELTRVATTDTESDWLAQSKGLAVNQIERLVDPEVFDRAACDARNLGSLDADVPERAILRTR